MGQGSNWTGWGWSFQRALIFPVSAAIIAVIGVSIDVPGLIVPASLIALLFIAALGPKKPARPLTEEEAREIAESVGREGDQVGVRLEIGAAFHYGLETDMSKFSPAQISENLARGKDPFTFVHPPEERARRANIPYADFGSTFNSFEEVHRVVLLLHQRYSRKVLGSNEKIARIVAALLAEVRSRPA